LEKVALINLGCPKNLVDAEVMLGHLGAGGYELTADAEAADVVVVNTCGFLQGAAQEAVDTLLQAAEWKRQGKCRAVVAAGCMVQRYGVDAAAALPEVDGFVGVGQAHELPAIVRGALAGERPSVLRGPAAGFEGYGLRLQATPSWTAYVKVSEGCDRRCAFCVIPSIRGPMVSRPVEVVAAEVEQLAARGTREVVLIGQDPTRYGVDRGEGHRLVALLERLSAIEALRWIRVMYLFPDRHAGPVLAAIAALPRVCRYVDMPLQHVSERVLRAMNRPGNGQVYRAMLAKLRAAAPEAWVRSTFITGFPGETERDFQELLAFVREGAIDWLGAFRYSREEGSPAAAFRPRVRERVAARRYEALMEAQQEVVAGRLGRWVGRDVEVLLESRAPGGGWAGRIAGQAPDVDGETRLEAGSLPGCRPGDFVRATVTAVDGYDLVARAVEVAHRSPFGERAPAPDLIQLAV
jgi:ribosomal protein S12 methylthiotransferase